MKVHAPVVGKTVDLAKINSYIIYLDVCSIFIIQLLVGAEVAERSEWLVI